MKKFLKFTTTLFLVFSTNLYAINSSKIYIDKNIARDAKKVENIEKEKIEQVLNFDNSKAKENSENNSGKNNKIEKPEQELQKIIEDVVSDEFFEIKEEEKGCSDVFSSLVLLENNGEILHSKRSRKISYPASLVKLMTAYLVFEAIENGEISPDDEIEVSARGEEISNVNRVTTLHLKEGDKILVRQAIRAMIIKSMNEAAVSLAEKVAGNEWNFARKMNKKAKELGMYNSSFRNASGLHAEGQYTTTYDLARLAIALKRDFPGYYHLFSKKDFEFNGKNFTTHNHVLVEYEGAEGMKTGFTNASGFNLIAVAKKDNSRVISVLLGCESYKKRDEYTKNLLDKTFTKSAKNNDNEIKVKLLENFNYSKIPFDETLENKRHSRLFY